MPGQTRYVTVSGAVPNGGFPPGAMFTAIVASPPVPDTAYCGPPPAYNAPPAAAAAPAGWYEPPEQNVGGSILLGEHTNFCWLTDGKRPIDAPNGYYPEQFKYSKYKVASVTTVGGLIDLLHAPPGEDFGITQMEPMGNDSWATAVTITRGSEMARRTLAEMGWTQRRSEAAPIWLCVKRPPGNRMG